MIRRVTSVWNARLSEQAKLALGRLQMDVKQAGFDLAKLALRGATVDMVVEAACVVARRYLAEVVAEVERIAAGAPSPDDSQVDCRTPEAS